MSYLLDTCLVSELTKPLPDAGVRGWLAQVASDQLFISVITVGELKKGIYKLPDSRRKLALAAWLGTLLADYQSRILPYDLAVAQNWGVLQAESELAGTPMATLDGQIAATAHTFQLTIVTRNVRDFAPARVAVWNPWG